MGSKFSLSRMRKELAASTMTSTTFSADISLLSGLVLSDVGTLAASGTNISTAAQLVNHVTMVTDANGTKGVQLPVVTNGELYVVANTGVSATLLLYPSTGSSFNGYGLNSAIALTGSQGAVCIYASSSIGPKWAVVWGGAS